MASALHATIAPVIPFLPLRRRGQIAGPHNASAVEYDQEEEFEMVQAYGIAPAEEHEGVQPRLDAGESDALLGANASIRRPERDGHATMSSSVGNLANTIIGSGMCRPSFRDDLQPY